MASIKVLTAWLQIGLFMNVNVLCRQIPLGQDVLYLDSLMEVKNSTITKIREARNVEGSGFSEIKPIQGSAKHLMERMTASLDQHPSMKVEEFDKEDEHSANNAELAVNGNGEQADGRDLSEELNSSKEVNEYSDSRGLENDPKDDVENLPDIDEGSGEIPMPKTAAIISETDHLFAEEEGMDEVYKELNKDDSLELITNDNNKQDNSISTNEAVGSQHVDDDNVDEGSGVYPYPEVFITDVERDSSSRQNKHDEGTKSGSEEETADSIEFSVPDATVEHTDKERESAEAINIEEHLKEEDALKNKDLDSAGEENSYETKLTVIEGVPEDEHGSPEKGHSWTEKSVEEEIVKSSGSDLYAPMGFDESKEEKGAENDEITFVDVFDSGAKNIPLEKNILANDTSNEEENEAENEEAGSIVFESKQVDDEISGTTEKEDIDKNDNAPDVTQSTEESPTTEAVDITETSSLAPDVEIILPDISLSEGVTTTESTLETSSTPKEAEINYPEIALSEETTTEEALETTSQVHEEYITTSEIVISGDVITTTEDSMTSDSSLTAGKGDIQEISTEPPVVTMEASTEISTPQTEDSSTETTTEKYGLPVSVESSLLETSQNLENGVLSSGNTEEKSLGAYIIIALIGISFLALIVFLALRKLSRRQEARLDNNQDRDPEKALLSNGKYKDDSDENNVKNNEIAPLVIKQNSQINKFEKNPNFSSPKNLNTTANEKNVEKDNVLKSTQAIIEDDEDAKKAIDEEKKNSAEDTDGVEDEKKALMGENSPTEKVVVRTHLDQDSIPKRPVLVTRNGNGYHSVSQDPV